MTRKLITSVVLSWLVIASITPSVYLENIPLAKAADLTVDTTADVNDAGDCATITAVNLPGGGGAISLREAICVANNTVGSDTILFGAGINGGTITLGSALPTISDTIIIDGGGDTLIDGNGQGGMFLNANSSTIKGLQLFNFSGATVILDIGGNSNTIGGTGAAEKNYFYGNAQKHITINGSSNIIIGNHIGVKPDNSSVGATQFGIRINGTNNIVGGATPGERNIISDNDSAEISIGGTASGTIIKGNYIGTTPDGSAGLGTSQVGIEIIGASNVTIGGSNAGEGNLISGHSGYAISQDNASNGVYIYGNYIGTNAAGTVAIANSRGIKTNGGNTNIVIGGNTAGHRNVISGNTNTAIEILGGSGVTVKGNYIGIKADASAALQNGKGIVIGNGALNTMIGGTNVGDGNVISGNNGTGLEIQSSTTVKGNKIGTDPNGTLDMGNNGSGILVSSNGAVTIGDPATNGLNIISGNATDGITINGGANSYAITISGNYIGTNAEGTTAIANNGAGVKVQFAPNGVTVNVGNLGSATMTNLISGNGADGVNIINGLTRVFSSYIGTNAAGTGAVANMGVGVNINATNAIIGNNSLSTGFNVISGNNARGIYVGNNGKSAIISGNYIGTSFDGTASIPNPDGIFVENNPELVTIGQSSSATMTNVISGNGGTGIKVVGSEDILIFSSAIGTNAAGTGAVSNGTFGISADNSGFTIGNNDLTGGFNIISGNSGTGIVISSPNGSGKISGNIIGLDITGSAKIANGWAGIYIKNASTSGLTIGDSVSATATNVISGNNEHGIAIEGTDNIKVYSSIIGADKNQTASTTIGNASAGIRINNSNAVIIGNTQGAGWNVISNNNGPGIRVGGNNVTIQGNFISTDRTKTHDLGNVGEGIAIDGGKSGTIIGGTTAGLGNIIRYSDSFGILASNGAVDLIRGNLIFQNGTPGKPIKITTPGAWTSGSLTFSTATTSKAAGSVVGFPAGTTIDLYSGTDAVNPALMKYEGSTVTGADGTFQVNADFSAVAGEYFYATIVDTVAKKTSEASAPSAAIVQDSTAPVFTVTSSITPTSNSAYTFTGTKESFASIENDGTVWTDKTDGTTSWTRALTLSEGANVFNLCSEDFSANRSGTGTYTITLDTGTPSAPTLSYSSQVSSATTSITVTGEVGTKIFVNGVYSGVTIGAGGTESVTVSLTSGANAFSITLKDSASNTSSSTNASITGGDPITYGGGGSGGGGSSGDSVSTTTDSGETTDTNTETPTEEEAGTDELAGEDEAGVENFEELPETETETTETTTEQVADETTTDETTETITETTQTQVEIIPIIKTEVVEEKIDENTVIISYIEPTDASSTSQEAKVLEIKLNTELKPEDNKGINITAIGGTTTGEEQTKQQKEEVINSFIEKINTIAEENELDIKIEKVMTQVFTDDDGDGMPEIWEEKYLGDNEFIGTADTDKDGLTNAEEYKYGSDPANNDTDEDGLSDGIEVLGLGTNPGTWDTDNDGLSDVKEIFSGTSATEKDTPSEIDTATYDEYADSDKDGMSDYIEAELGTDPTSADSDNDGLTDSQEFEYDTNPSSATSNIVYGNPKKTKPTNIKDGSILSTSSTLLKGTSTPNTKVLINILDANNNPVAVIETEVDANGKFATTMSEGLTDGTYQMFIVGTDEKGKNAKDISPISTFTIDSTKAVEGITTAEVETATAATTEEKTKIIKIRGHANPKSKVYATWKSFIFSSVLMSDSETGEFVVEAPADLEEGDHTAYLYSIDEETGIQGEVMMVNFAIAGENLANETTGIPGEGSANSKYIYLLLLPILIGGGIYIYYRKSKEEKKTEEKLIEKLEHKK